MTPTVVIVGRPNVGKSTLFNRLTRSRDAIVADIPGLTRDRHYARGRVGHKSYLVVDTGGLEPVVDTGVVHAMAQQTLLAIDEADAVVFLVDGRAGLTTQDSAIADQLRKTGRRIWLVVNKAEGMQPATVGAEFHELGLGEPLTISAAHGEGVSDLADLITADFPDHDEPTDDEAPQKCPRIAIVGRPNVGKSTLVNSLLGEDRVVVFDEPGTTRDSIYIDFERAGRRYTLIDTAGVRRRGNVTDVVEKFSVIKTLQAVEDANVVVLVLDAREGIVDQDAHIAGYIVDAGRARPDDIYGVFMAPPVEVIDQPYTLDQVRFSAPLRDRMPRVDLDVNFDTGSWQLSPDQVDRLSVIADGINRAIERNPREVFMVEGHTDAVGNDVDNLSLSDRRAESAATLLTQQFQVPAENLTSQGYG